ncbi:TonB-dependent receptor-like protein [Mucilaginibacter gracilis]|uniref:TonB-dependent receptor-like protein n=1 Tax=Mucilaginibacter gracilis TaxID=423350 RepID=A0A495J8V4_9SPHI|nr:TonB-dependent receptor [Mucilaginibacter gracilis]RKR84824.1 TonB-dependent receptor-like protein [Mucilaginibacter gracilis]
MLVSRLKNNFFKLRGLVYLPGLVLLLCLPGLLRAQSKLTISGIVKDSTTGEALIGATIKTGQNGGVITNSYGFYSLTVSPNTYTVLVSYIGYKTKPIPVNIDKNTRLDIELTADNALSEINVTAKTKAADNVLSAQMGVNKLSMTDIANIPVLLGEKDIIKTIELLPGVKSTGDANTGFYVRGGNADENLILLDGATVYNASHLFGFFSTFNSDAIREVSLYKGGMFAGYGGRLSSVLDIKMDEGNNKQYGVEGGIGLISSRIKIEGPIVKNKSSFMISARRTYADVFLKLSSDTSINTSSLYFYDVNAKFNYQLDDKNTLYLSAYLGKDDVGVKNTFATDWGNTTATLRWNHVFSGKLFSNTSFIYSKYNYNIANYDADNDIKVYSKIEDFNLKQDFDYFIANNNTLRFGFAVTHHTVVPGDISTSEISSFNPKVIETRYAYEWAAYLSNSWQPANKLNMVYGARLNVFNLIGPGNFNTYNADGYLLSTQNYSAGQGVVSYINLEPRFLASYTFNSNTSVKVSYNHNSQNIHLLSNSTSALPTDLYVMSSNNVKPGIADQVSLGYYRNFNHNGYEFSAEVYYKWLKNEIDYRDNAQLLANSNVEQELVYGTGRAYGLELFLKKKYGRYNGWLGYTLSKTERRFDAINNGNYFPARQDRTHDVSLVNMYGLSKRWSVSAVFTYGTGNAVTYPAGKYRLNGITTYYYGARNASRLPVNSRLDLGATLQGKQHKSYHSSVTFSVYNAYNRKNPYSVIFRDSAGSPPHTEAVETSLFGIIPSVTWNFNFK